MKVIQINTSYGHGDSTGRTTKEMHYWLTVHGNESYVIASKIREDGIADKNVFSCGTKILQKSHAFFSRLTGLQGYFSVTDTKRLLRRLDQITPDVVILRVLHSNCLNFPMLLNYLGKKAVPTILVLHDCWYYTGHCCYYVQYGCEQWKNGCERCGHMDDWNKSWFFRTAAKCLRDKQNWYHRIPKLAVVGVSDWVTEDARQSVLNQADIIKRIFNWIDLEAFYPRNNRLEICERHHLDPKKPLLFAVNAWSDNKGKQEILAVTRELDVNLIAVSAVRDKPPRRENVLLLGRITDPFVLAEYYSAADAFLNPSYYETFGKPTAEALCCGTPVVAYNSTGSGELVNAARGAAVETGNISDYIHAVLTVLEKGKAYYRENCVKFAQENFSMETNMRAYMELIQELIGN